MFKKICWAIVLSLISISSLYADGVSSRTAYIIVRFTGAPTTPQEGDIYENLTSHLLFYYDGTTFQQISTGSGAVAPLTLSGPTLTTTLLTLQSTDDDTTHRVLQLRSSPGTDIGGIDAVGNLSVATSVNAGGLTGTNLTLDNATVRFTAAGGHTNILDYVDNTGPRWTDANRGQALTHGLQLLTANRIATWPDANTVIPVIPQAITISGPTAARTITVPDASFTAARTDAANTFTGNQTFSGSMFVNGASLAIARGTSITTTSGGTDGAVLLNASGAITFQPAPVVFKQIADGNGGSFTRSTATELLTLSTSGTTTATVGNLAPVGSRIAAILYRITTTIATATAFTVKVTGGNVMENVGTATTSQTTLTSGTTGILVPAAFADQYNNAATTLTVTTTGTPSAGVIRLTVIYEQYSAPTS